MTRIETLRVVEFEEVEDEGACFAGMLMLIMRAFPTARRHRIGVPGLLFLVACVVGTAGRLGAQTPGWSTYADPQGRFTFEFPQASPADIETLTRIVRSFRTATAR